MGVFRRQWPGYYEPKRYRLGAMGAAAISANDKKGAYVLFRDKRGAVLFRDKRATVDR